MVCFLSKYLKFYNFGKRTTSEKRKPVSDSVTRNLHKKLNTVKKNNLVFTSVIKQRLQKEDCSTMRKIIIAVIRTWYHDKEMTKLC